MPPIDLVYLFVSDMDRAVAFYGDTLGLTMQYRSGDDWAQFDAGKVSLGLHGLRPGEPPQAGGTVGFTVEDLDAAKVALGVAAIAIDHEGGGEGREARFVTFRDPDGNALAYFERKGA